MPPPDRWTLAFRTKAEREAAANAATYLDLPSWPAPLRPFIRSLGADAVWHTATETLGYPPTWGMTGKEILAVLQALKTLEERQRQHGP